MDVRLIVSGTGFGRVEGAELIKMDPFYVPYVWGLLKNVWGLLKRHGLVCAKLVSANLVSTDLCLLGFHELGFRKLV